MITILRACSGAGKSTWLAQNRPDSTVVSADHFFIKNGSYQFSPAELGQAHAECLRRFCELVRDPAKFHLAVDNTNCTAVELAPYLALAQAYQHEAEIVRLRVDPAVAHARNQHGVPIATVQRQAELLATERLPPYWPAETLIQF